MVIDRPQFDRCSGTLRHPVSPTHSIAITNASAHRCIV